MPKLIPVDGGVNFRDFGGYATRNGSTINYGLLFRSGHLAGLSEAGREHLHALGVRTICDLRGPNECLEDPTPFGPHELTLVAIPLDPGSAVALRGQLANDILNREERIRYMREINRELAREHVAGYARMFSALLNTDGGFLLHCTAGKDRTGFGAALIHRVLGVEESCVMRDFMWTNETLDFARDIAPRWRERLGRDVQMFDARELSGVLPEYLESAFAVIDEEYGGMEGYKEALGLDAVAQQRLAERLLQPA